jgi:O-antigen ligase
MLSVHIMSIVKEEDFTLLFSHQIELFYFILLLPMIANLVLNNTETLAKNIYKIIILCAVTTLGYDILLLIEKPDRHVGLLVNPITRGNWGMLIGLLSYVSFFAVDKKHWKLLALLGFFSGVALSILSGTRGGWLALPLVLFTSYFLVVRYTIFKKTFLIIVVILMLSILLLWSFLPIEQRIMLMFQDIQAYINGETATSLGARFEAWKASTYAFLDKPIMGWGINHFDNYVLHYNNLGLTKATTLGNAHNDFFHFLGALGIIGTLSFLLIIIVPFYFLASHLTKLDLDIQQRVLILLGFTTIESMIEFSLSYQTLSSRYMFQFYVIFIVTILSLLHNKQITNLNSNQHTAHQLH